MTRRTSVMKFKTVVAHITMINNSLSSIRHKQQEREHQRKLLTKDIINLESEEDCQFIIYILGKEVRSKEQISYLKRAFHDLKFFREKQQMLNDNLYYLLFRGIKHQFIEKQQAIFNYGDSGEIFYIVLRGSAALLIPKDPDSADTFKRQFQEEFTEGLSAFNAKYSMAIKMRKQKLTRQGSSSSCGSIQLAKMSKRSSILGEDLNPQHKISLKDVIKAQALSQFFNANFDATQMNQSENQRIYIDAYHSHTESFALQKYDQVVLEYFSFCYPSFRLAKIFSVGDSFGEIALMTNQPRTATVVCLEDTHCMILHKEQFQTILERYRHQIYQEKINLLKQFPLFQSLNYMVLHQLIDFMVIQQPRIFEIIFKENQTSQYLYMIKEGEVEIDALQQSDPLLSTTNIPLSTKNKSGSQNRTCMALLGQGSIFGYEDILEGKLRSTRAIAKSSQCELYLLPAQIVRNIAARMRQTIDQTSAQSAQRLKSTVSSIRRNDKAISSLITFLAPSQPPPSFSTQISVSAYLSSSSKPDQIPSSIDYHKQAFQSDYTSVSRFQTASKSKQLIKLKRRVMKQQFSVKASPKTDIHHPLFADDKITPKASSFHSRNQTSTTTKHFNFDTPRRLSQATPDQYYSQGQLLLTKVFRTQSRQQLSKILQHPSEKLIKADLGDSRVNSINLSPTCSPTMSRAHSKKPSVNMHSHLFSPKVHDQPITIHRKLSDQLIKLK